MGTIILMSFLATHGALSPAPVAAAAPAPAAYSAPTINLDVQSYAGSLRQCYNEHRPAVREHIGRIRLRFELASDGRVAAAVIEHDGLHSRAATACMRDAVRYWHFPPPPSAPAELEYTFLFR